jgi:hypothetical protein
MLFVNYWSSPADPEQHAYGYPKLNARIRERQNTSLLNEWANFLRAVRIRRCFSSKDSNSIAENAKQVAAHDQPNANQGVIQKQKSGAPGAAFSKSLRD